MNYYEKSLLIHEQKKGKLEISSKVNLEHLDDLCTYYTPGVASPCRKIHENPQDAYRFTMKSNTVAVVSDGSSVLGLGNLGPFAAIPVMEGKCILFKEFGNVDAFPICLDTQNVDEIVQTVLHISPVFGGINLEDISSPRCAEIERALDRKLNIPVFHDDQHGTAIVVAAGVINALKATGRETWSKEKIKICIFGAGSAGLAIASMLSDMGYLDISLINSKGVLTLDSDLNWYQKEVMQRLHSSAEGNRVEDAARNADIFIGVSNGGKISGDLIRVMKENPIVFALSNPEPEITPEEALEAGAYIIGTGRSDFPNQISNLLAYPGIFRGALNAKSKITGEMKMAAVQAIADSVSEASIANGIVIPSAMDKKVHEAVAEAVYMAGLIRS